MRLPESGIEFTIKGAPIPKARQRTLKAGFSYNPQSKEEAAVRFYMEKVTAGRDVYTGPLSIKIDCYFERPKGHYGTGRNAGILKASAPKYHTKKPDIDNVIKFYKDCMNGIVYKDDSQCITVLGRKVYATQGCVHINIYPVGAQQ